jgi:hypothetical protein
VGEGGVEPPPGCPDRILNPARLPIPPLARVEANASKLGKPGRAQQLPVQDEERLIEYVFGIGFGSSFVDP